MGHCSGQERCSKTMNLGLLSAAASLLLIPSAAMAQPQVDPLAEPLTRDELKPTYFAIVECARRNQEPGCLAARQLADELMDRPFVTAFCKDTAYAVTQQAKTAATNSFERKDQLVRLARDTMDLCKGKEDPIPVYGELDNNKVDDNKINVLDLLN
tara:strand:+ start:352 stop:819 length:468 start_codon:yes stop_codon:yes gene_type:complete